MNKKEVLTQVSEKSEIAIDVCEKVIDAFEKQFGDVLLKKIKGEKKIIIDIAESISQKNALDLSVCEKVLTAFKEVFDKELSDKLKFWK